jgi:signal transduction histidine kinase
MEKRYTHKRGHIVTALTTVSLVRDGQGQPLYLIAQIQDVTERKLAKQEAFWKTTLLEAQLESSIDGILVVGTEGEQILQNRRMTELWKFPAAIVEAKDEAAQLRYATSQVKNSKPFIERVNYLYAHPDQTSQDEVELVDGTIMDRYSAPIRDQAGKYYGRIWSFRDITERRKLEQNLYQTQKLESIGQLAGGIAHDFNNILAAIVGYISLTKVAAADSPVTLGYLDHIAKASDRAIALVRQILTFSRQNKPERETVKLNVVVLEALKLLRASVPATIRIQTELTETPTVLANTSAIHQIVMNLGTNA